MMENEDILNMQVKKIVKKETEKIEKIQSINNIPSTLNNNN